MHTRLLVCCFLLCFCPYTICSEIWELVVSLQSWSRKPKLCFNSCRAANLDKDGSELPLQGETGRREAFAQVNPSRITLITSADGDISHRVFCLCVVRSFAYHHTIRDRSFLLAFSQADGRSTAPVPSRTLIKQLGHFSFPDRPAAKHQRASSSLVLPTAKSPLSCQVFKLRHVRRGVREANGGGELQTRLHAAATIIPSLYQENKEQARRPLHGPVL